jgi:hypothetical protein
MRTFYLRAFLLVSLALLALGCSNNTGAPPADEEAKIKAALDKLDPADRKLAVEQKYCAVETENPLGKMGKPVKVMINDRPVFLCCKGCENTAKKDPDKTLDTVEKLKSANAKSKTN